MPDWSKIECLGFSVFGTLVDADRGVAEALAACARVQHAPQQERIIDEWYPALGELVDDLEEFRPWHELVAESLVTAASRSGTILAAGDAARIAASAGDWPLFPDTSEALHRLAGEYRLAFVSNFERPVLEAVAARIGVPIGHMVTSSDVSAYKPEQDLLLALLHELSLDEDQILYCSAEPEGDLVTAVDLGIPCALINRRRLNPPEDIDLDLHLFDAGHLARRLLDRHAAPAARPESGRGRGPAGKKSGPSPRGGGKK